jgi:hypothetical protein
VGAYKYTLVNVRPDRRTEVGYEVPFELFSSGEGEGM